MATDEQLIEQIKNGAREAYGQLFSKYYQRIYNTCLFILKNPQDAEEVTQEAFVDSYLKLGQLKSPGKFFAWLKSIAKNRSIKYLHRKQREIVRSGGVLVGSGVVPLTQIAPDELLLRQELIDAIMEAIESLPKKDREVIQSHIEGLNHSEISQRFGISIGASMSRLYRARKKIAAYMKDLLNAIVVFPKTLSFKKIVSGGIKAMKVGTSKEVTTGIITATQSLTFSVIFHIALFIALSFVLPYKFHADRQKVDIHLEVSLLPPAKEQQPAQRLSKGEEKSVVSVKKSFLPIKKESLPKAPRGFLAVQKPALQGEINEAIIRMGQGLKELQIGLPAPQGTRQAGAGMSVKGRERILSGSGKGGKILPTVDVKREPISEVGKGDVGLVDGVGKLTKGRIGVKLEMKKAEKLAPVSPQKGKFDRKARLSIVGDIGVVDADDTLANVTKDMILDRTGFGVSELPKGEPGGVIIGRGKEIEGRLRFGRLSCSMVDERYMQGFSRVLNYWIKWINANTNIKTDINVEGGAISLTDANLFKCPILFLFGYNEGMYSEAGWYASDPTLTGYSIWTSGGQAASHLSSKERQLLRKYLVEKGGVLFVDTMPRIIASYYGNQKTLGSHYPWSMRMKRELRTILPEYNFQNIENEHKLYHCFYDLGGMTPGLPKTKSWTNVESDFFGFRFSPSAYIQGISIDGKLALIYSENASALMANNSFDYLSTKAAFRFLTNVVVYGLTHSGISDKSRYVPEKEIPVEIPTKPPVIPPPTPNLRP